MAKPWAKYEVGFINHPKFRAINANAIALWLEGKNYADEKHTDGLLPIYEVKLWRFFSKKTVEMLTTSCGPKPGAECDYRPLWEVVPGFGFRMHDYLAHNDSRDVVLQRKADIEAERARDRQRKAEAREARRQKMSARTSAGHPPDFRRTSAEIQAVSGESPTLDRRQIQSTTPQPPSGGLLVADDIAEQAGDFLRRYPVVYATAKNNASYHVREARDFPIAIDLVSRWPDVEYLCKMLELFLRKQDWAPKNVPGSPGQFRHMAPECDALLRRHGHAPAASRAAS